FVPGVPTPTGTVAQMAPAPAFARTLDIASDPPPIVFLANNGFAFENPVALVVAEPSGGANGGGVVFMTANQFAAYSTDGGATFTQLDPTTIFPEDDGGFCCDQIVQYVPSIDRFIWLLQYRRGP